MALNIVVFGTLAAAIILLAAETMDVMSWRTSGSCLISSETSEIGSVMDGKLMPFSQHFELIRLTAADIMLARVDNSRAIMRIYLVMKEKEDGTV